MPNSDPDQMPVTVAVLQAELGYLREFVTVRFDNLSARLDQSIAHTDGLAQRLDTIDGAMRSTVHDVSVVQDRITDVERWQRHIVGVILKWGSIGIGVAISVVAIIFGIAHALGWI